MVLKGKNMPEESKEKTSETAKSRKLFEEYDLEYSLCSYEKDVRGE